MATGISDSENIRQILTGLYPDEKLFRQADRTRREVYGDAVYLRGLIEISNYCVNNCYYCGIRKGNSRLVRYRLDKETILACSREGYRLGFRTFVLQGGEDPYYGCGNSGDGKGDERIFDIVYTIHSEFPDCAVTLSLGERSRKSYKALREAGARRYLLRHEAASDELYRMLHPEGMSLENRKRCLYDLKDLGYQVGAGFMVGAPGQTVEHLLEDIRFLEDLQPDMIGIGPYMGHADTPFAGQPNGSMLLTIRMVALLRIIFPYALIPSTTALASVDPTGRILGLKAGANVVMPNLSPADVRDQYSIYENKLHSGAEAAQSKMLLEKQVEEAGYHIVTDIGDVKR